MSGENPAATRRWLTANSSDSARSMACKHVRKQRRDPASLTAIDRLRWLGTRTMGALTYHPPADAERDPLALDLQRLADAAQRVLAGRGADVLPELLRAGGSPAGARPSARSCRCSRAGHGLQAF